MKRIPVRFTILALVLFAFHLRGTSQESVNADDAFSQSEQNKNAKTEFDRVNAELTKIYEREFIVTEKTPAVHEALIASQTAWLAFREADGRYESVESEGGSARTYYVNKRMTFLTRQRIYQLKTPFAQGWVESDALKGK